MTGTRRVGFAVLGVVAGAAVATHAESVRLKPDGSIYADRAGNALARPEGVACRAGALAVADTGHGRIVLYDVTDESVRGSGEIVVPQVPQPLAVAFLADGDLLALDGRSRRIGRVSPGGEFRGWLELDAGPVEPWSLAVGPPDRVHVLDLAGPRVLVVDPAGTLRRTIPIPSGCRFPSDIAVDGRGDVYLIDSVSRLAFAARTADTELVAIGRSLVDDLDFPTGIAVDDDGRLFVLDEHGGGVIILGRDGTFGGRQSSMGWKEGLVRYPVDACTDGLGSLFVAERGNSRVQRFRVN